MINMKIAALFALLVLSACATKPQKDGAGKQFDVGSVKPVSPYDEPKSKQGNPESYVVWGKRYFVMPSAEGYYEEGIASWYGSKFHGNNTSNGEVYDMYQLSAAHKSLPLPTYVEVINLSNQRKIILRVNDRGPFHGKRIIDLSYAAALKLDMVRTGTANVSVRAITAKPKPSESIGQLKPHTGNSVLPAPTLPPVEAAKWRDESHLQGRLFTQVGAYSLKQNAEKVQRELIAKQFKYVSIYPDPEKSLYRLRLGPHRNTQEAEHVLSQLKAQGYPSAQMVVLKK